MDAAYFTSLYQAFADAESKFTTAGVPPVAFIDRYRGQPLNPEQYEYYPLPAIFIQRRAKWEKKGNFYDAQWELNFHIVTEPTWDTSNIATNKEEGLKYFTFLDCVREVLDNFKTETTGSMTRTEDEVIDSGVTVYEALGYECPYYSMAKVGVQYASEYPEDMTVMGRKLKTKGT